MTESFNTMSQSLGATQSELETAIDALGEVESAVGEAAQ